MTDDQQQVEATQADRDAAAGYQKKYPAEDNPFAFEMERGDADSTPLVQAFARHRIAHSPASLDGLAAELANPWVNNPTDSERGPVPDWCHALMHKAATALSRQPDAIDTDGDAEKLVDALAELQLSSFLAGRGSVQFNQGQRKNRPAPTMEDFKNMARSAVRAALSQPDAMREALGTARSALCEHACHGGDSIPCIRSAEQCRTDCGKQAGDAILAIDAALNERQP